MKKIVFLFGIVVLLGACGNLKTKQSEATSDAKESSSISVDSFLVVAGNNVGKELSVIGTVDHVCKHGGKRVRIFSADPSKSIEGEASNKVGSFNAELEGSDVCLTGTVKETKIDLAYVDEWEAKKKEAMAKNADESDMEHKDGIDHHANLEQIKNYRDQITASKKGYISFYFLDVSEFHECKISDNNGVGSSFSPKTPCCENEVAMPCFDDKKEGKTISGGSES